MLRLLVACLVGVGVAVLAAVVLGDYPLSGAVPWTAAVVIPAVVGVPMTALAGRHQRALWAATGPLSAGAFGWGVAIATGWGLDPVPTAAWAGLAVTLAWPLALAAALHQRRLTGDAPV